MRWPDRPGRAICACLPAAVGVLGQLLGVRQRVDQLELGLHAVREVRLGDVVEHRLGEVHEGPLLGESAGEVDLRLDGLLRHRLSRGREGQAERGGEEGELAGEGAGADGDAHVLSSQSRSRAGPLEAAAPDFDRE